MLVLGGLAQLGEHLLHVQGVTGSSPVISIFFTGVQKGQSAIHLQADPFCYFVRRLIARFRDR